MGAPLADFGSLWSVVQEEAQRENMKIAQNCEGLLRDLITQKKGAWRKQGFAKEDESENLREFVRAMIEEAKSQGAAELHEWSFEAAKRKLCPIWPFC